MNFGTVEYHIPMDHALVGTYIVVGCMVTCVTQVESESAACVCFGHAKTPESAKFANSGS